MKRLRPYLPALGIFCLALLVRLVYNLTVARNYVAGYDSQAYEKIAVHLLQEHCFCLDPIRRQPDALQSGQTSLPLSTPCQAPGTFLYGSFYALSAQVRVHWSIYGQKIFLASALPLLQAFLLPYILDSSSMMVGYILNPCILSSFWLFLTPCILYSIPQNAAG